MELESSTDHIRVEGASPTIAPGRQHAEIEQQRFSLITPEEASQLPEAKKFLEVGILERIKGFFSSKQAEETGRKASLIRTRTSAEFHEKLLNAPLGSRIKFDGERIVQGGVEAKLPLVARRFFRKFRDGIQSVISGSKNPYPLRSSAQYDVATEERKQGVILRQESLDRGTDNSDRLFIIDRLFQDASFVFRGCC